MPDFNGKFSIYEHILVINDFERVTRQFIVIKDEYGILHFTDFHKYCVNPKRRITRFTQSGNTRCKFIAAFLNYVFQYRELDKLSNLTSEMVKEYLTLYGKCELPDDDMGTHRSKATVERCAAYIFDFCEMLSRDLGPRKDLLVKNLYRETDSRDKHGHLIKVKVPDFDLFYSDSGRSPIYRDIPNQAFILLFQNIYEKHKDLLGVVMLSAFAGLRPAEACNVRREDSLLGPGIIIQKTGNRIDSIDIDIRREIIMRNDRVSVGSIKKERLQSVPRQFLKAFTQTYNIYMDYMNGKPLENPSRPFSTNAFGKALTYRVYYLKFQEIIRNEMTPIYLASDDPEIVRYGRILLEHRLSPHIFRHWYTVQLVLSGVKDPGVLMHLRGDNNPESSLVYLKGKGELAKKYRKISDSTFEYSQWAAEKLYGHSENS